jgi:hypothetical protein
MTQFVATTGAYFRDFDERNIFHEIFDVEGWMGQHLNIQDGNPDEIAKGEIKFAKVLKPKKAAWTPTANAVEFKARLIKVRNAEVTVEIDHNDVKAMHKSFLSKMKRPGAQANNLPFEAEIMNGFVDQAKKDLALDALFKGVYNASGSNPADIFDGFNKVIADEITATNIVPAVTGAITKANVLDKLDIIVDSINAKYRYKPMKCYVSPDIAAWYFSTYKASNSGQAPNQKDVIRTLMNGRTIQDTSIFLDNSLIELVPTDGLVGSQRIIITPQDNMILSFDSLNDMDTLNVEFARRIFSIYMDMSVGVGFHRLTDLWTNNVA